MEELGGKKAYIVREAFQIDYGAYTSITKTPGVWAAGNMEEARALCEQLRRRCRHVNPFQDKSRSLSDHTSLTIDELVHRFRDLNSPSRESQDWISWWDTATARFSDDQLARVWDAFDKVHPYIVEETKVNTVQYFDTRSLVLPAKLPRFAYVVQKLYWEYNDNWHDLRDDEPIKAYLDRDMAELQRMEFEEAERSKWQPLRLTGQLQFASSLTEAELLAYFEQHGISPPPRTIDGGEESYEFSDEAWWATLQRRLPRRMFQDVWDLFDLVRFYEVVAVELDK